MGKCILAGHPPAVPPAQDASGLTARVGALESGAAALAGRVAVLETGNGFKIACGSAHAYGESVGINYSDAGFTSTPAVVATLSGVDANLSAILDKISSTGCVVRSSISGFVASWIAIGR